MNIICIHIGSVASCCRKHWTCPVFAALWHWMSLPIQEGFAVGNPQNPPDWMGQTGDWYSVTCFGPELLNGIQGPVTGSSIPHSYHFAVISLLIYVNRVSCSLLQLKKLIKCPIYKPCYILLIKSLSCHQLYVHRYSSRELTESVENHLAMGSDKLSSK